MKPLTNDSVPRLKTAMRLARRLGCTVEPRGASGEYRVTAPDGTRVNVNNRRDDATRELTTMLVRLQEAKGLPRAKEAPDD